MKSESKIAVLSHGHPSISKGGAEISAYALYTGLRQLGRPVSFIAACASTDRQNVLMQTPDEYLISYNPAHYDPFYHIAPLETVEQVEQVVNSIGADLLFFHHFLAFGLNTIHRLSEAADVFFTFHEFLALCHNHGQMITTQNSALCKHAHPALCGRCFPQIDAAQFSVRQAFFSNMLGGASGYISPSRFLMERFVHFGFPQNKFHVIENGLLAAGDRNVLDGVSANGYRHMATDEKDKPFVIGFFGQLNPFKGLDVILDASEQIHRDPELKGCVIFRVHGSIVSLPDEIRARFEKAIGTGVLEYKGAYDNSDVLNLMRECNYILMASKWWENSPVVIQEAYLARRPLLVPDAGGMAEKVQHGVNGFRFKLGDPTDLVRVIKSAMHFDPGQFEFPQPSSATEMARSYLKVSENVQRHTRGGNS